MITLVTVGTGTVSPSATRASAAHWLEINGDASTHGRMDAPVRLLMDCGAGTVHGLARHGLPWFDITHIAITHFHTDHIGELPALIFAMKYGGMQHRSAPLTIYGPVGLHERMKALAAAFGDWVTAPGFPLDVQEVKPDDLRTTHHALLTIVTGVTLSACKTPHTEESLAYSVATSGVRLVYTGDTGSSSELGDWARGCDLLLAECSLPDSMAMDIHLTPASAGALAERAQAKRLVLTHLYPPVETENIPAIVARLYAGPVTVARDGERFRIGA